MIRLMRSWSWAVNRSPLVLRARRTGAVWRVRATAGADGSKMEAAAFMGTTGALAGGVTGVARRVLRSMACPSRAIVESARDFVGVDLVIEIGYAACCDGALMAWC